MPKKKISKEKTKKRKPRKTKKKKTSKRETQEEKEKRQEKEIKKLDKELREVDLEIKKVALKHGKIILDDWEKEEESKGLTSPDSGLDLSDARASLEMVNAPQRRLVPLENVLEVETSSPTFGTNGNKDSGSEFNPFKYTPGSQDSEGPKYTSHYSEIAGVEKIDIATDSRKPLGRISEKKEMSFTPMYNPNTQQDSERIFNPAKRVEINELGREKPGSRDKPEMKYTPSKEY